MGPQFDHEKLRAYQGALQFVAWLDPVIEKLPGKLAARDQLEEVCSHRLYPEILARLESISGKLFEIDIERAMYQAIKEEISRRTLRPPAR